MKRWILVLLCAYTIPLVIASNGQEEIRLKKGDIIYAFKPSWWMLKAIDAQSLPIEALECKPAWCMEARLFLLSDPRCKKAWCRYTVPPCLPLHVEIQQKNFTSALPKDSEARAALARGELESGLAGFGWGRSVPGGWSRRSQRLWSVSRDECLIKIGKQLEPKASPSPEPTPGPSPTPSE